MATFPLQVPRNYVNPGGNLSASGYYRSYVDQELANQFPQWMHIRDNPISVGQQFMSPMAMFLDELEHKMDDSFKSKFITTAPVDEIDVIYRLKLPQTIDITDANASGIRCIAAPSGGAPSGVNQIWVEQMDNLERFYYHVLPTRLEVVASGDYESSVDSITWHTEPSGILDLHQKYTDFWKVEHDLTWAYADSYFRKQDRETEGDYELYEIAETGMSDYSKLGGMARATWMIFRVLRSMTRGYGVPLDMYFYDDMLWWIGKETTGGVKYYLNISNPKTKKPQATYLELLAAFQLTNVITEHEPSGIIIDEERNIWISDTTKSKMYKLNPRYDYFILDRDNRYIYMREDYTDSGVFLSNT